VTANVISSFRSVLVLMDASVDSAWRPTFVYFQLMFTDYDVPYMTSYIVWI